MPAKPLSMRVPRGGAERYAAEAERYAAEAERYAAASGTLCRSKKARKCGPWARRYAASHGVANPTYSHQITEPQCSPSSGSMATLSKRPPE